MLWKEPIITTKINAMCMCEWGWVYLNLWICAIYEFFVWDFSVFAFMEQLDHFCLCLVSLFFVRIKETQRKAHFVDRCNNPNPRDVNNHCRLNKDPPHVRPRQYRWQKRSSQNRCRILGRKIQCKDFLQKDKKEKGFITLQIQKNVHSLFALPIMEHMARKRQ